MILSIIIPTLNEEKYLPLLLASIKKQDFKDYEIIVADAGSKDKTLEIAKKYKVRLTKGGLPAKGRNQGAKIAKGNIFLFLDAEAVLPEHFLKRVLLEFKERKLGIASCGLEPITKNKAYRILNDILYNWPVRLLENVFPYTSNFILVKREIHEKIQGFDQGITLGEDHAYGREAAKIAKFSFLRLSKLTLLPRRFEYEGWLTISAKYYFCNLYNIFFGNVRSNIFRYDLNSRSYIDTIANQGSRAKREVLKKRKKKKKRPKLQRVIFTALKSPIYIIWFVVGFATWLIIFLIFSPKLIVVYLKKKKK